MENNRSHHKSSAFIYLIVFIVGAAIMVIEMLGTRIIAPFYGVSLYVWTSIISVTMMALAMGYFFGGHLADRYSGLGLSWVIAFAAIFCLLIPLMTRWVLMTTDPLGLRVGAFASAFILFTPSLTLLGMVGPFAVKLGTGRLSGVGTSTGSIYAVSTLGSVLGTLSLGFFLFPLFGSRVILSGVGFFLLTLALMAVLYEKRYLGCRSKGIIVVSILGFSLLLTTHMRGVAHSESISEKGYQVLMDRESLYGWVRVMDAPRHDMRLLTSDASVIGASRISSGVSLLNYQNTIRLIPKFRPGIQRALIIGQGAGHLARDLSDQFGISTDTLELDPAVAEAASAWFGFLPSGRSVVGDGRFEIRRLKGPYDLIVHDCFTGGTEPTHLLTLEAFEQLRGLLSPSGILAINYVAFYDNGQNRALASVVKTLAEVFSYRSVLRNDKQHDFNDFILMASAQPIKPAKPGFEDWYERETDVKLEMGEILTDNYNPLEKYQLRKSEEYRAMVVDWLGQDLMVR